MTQPKERGGGPAQPYWETHYEQRDVEAMPWFYEALDPDVERALGELGIGSGRVLDLGTGPGTQAIALAERGFVVTGSDLSKAAVAKASERAATRGADVRFVVDDVLDSKLDGPFDVLLDRGCFHVLPAPRRVDYVATLARLAAPGGWLLLKTFSVDQPGETGPFRFAPETIPSLFGSAFEVRSIESSVYHGTVAPNPVALFCLLRARR